MAKIETIDASVQPEAPGGKKGAGKPKKKTFKKRGEKRVIHHGLAHIHASFNNTTITITDPDGAVIAWSSAGGIGFKGSRKGTPFAATQAAVAARNAAKAVGMGRGGGAARGPAAGAARRQRRQGVRHAQRRGAGEGAGRRSRVGDPRAADDRHRGQVDPRRHPDSPQRLQAAEASESLKFPVSSFQSW